MIELEQDKFNREIAGSSHNELNIDVNRSSIRHTQKQKTDRRYDDIELPKFQKNVEIVEKTEPIKKFNYSNSIPSIFPQDKTNLQNIENSLQYFTYKNEQINNKMKNDIKMGSIHSTD